MAASPEGLVYILPGKRRGKMFSSGAKANLCSELMSEINLRRPTARKAPATVGGRCIRQRLTFP